MKKSLLNILCTISLALNGFQGCTSQNSEKLNLNSSSFSLENKISNTYSEILSSKPSKRIIVKGITDSTAYNHIYNFEDTNYKLQLTFISPSKNREKSNLAILVYKERDDKDFRVKEIFYDNKLNGLDGNSDDEYRSSANSASPIKQFQRIYRFNSSDQDSLNNRLIDYLTKLAQLTK